LLSRSDTREIRSKEEKRKVQGGKKTKSQGTSCLDCLRGAQRSIVGGGNRGSLERKGEAGGKKGIRGATCSLSVHDDILAPVRKVGKGWGKIAQANRGKVGALKEQTFAFTDRQKERVMEA